MTSIVKRLYQRIPLSVRDRLRMIKRPAWSAVGIALAASSGSRTITGPFAGMRLPLRPHRPTILGTNELELHAWIEQLIAEDFRRIVNIGGGFGYYAVGFALRCPRARIIVFEMHDRSRRVLEHCIAMNGAGAQIDVREEGSHATLRDALAGPERSMVFLDIEGGERDLLDPQRVPELVSATIIVETHDVLVPDCESTIRARFASTHRIQAVATRQRTMADLPTGVLPFVRHLFPVATLESLQEFRGGPQTWLLLEPLA
jgi:predicted O-methyltransferase YrrM